MHKGRLEALSDGVVATLVAIMAPEPGASHGDPFADPWPLLPAAFHGVVLFPAGVAYYILSRARIARRLDN